MMIDEQDVRCYIDDEEVDCETFKYIPCTEEVDERESTK